MLMASLADNPLRRPTRRDQAQTGSQLRREGNSARNLPPQLDPSIVTILPV